MTASNEMKKGHPAQLGGDGMTLDAQTGIRMSNQTLPTEAEIDRSVTELADHVGDAVKSMNANERACLEVIASWPAEELDPMIAFLQTAPRWKIDFILARVKDREAGNPPLSDDEYEAAYLKAEAAGDVVEGGAR